MPRDRSFVVPAHGSYALALSVSPNCSSDQTTAFVRLLTGAKDGVAFWVGGVCRYPFTVHWELDGDGRVRIPIIDGFDTDLLDSLTCYWYPSDAAAAASVERDGASAVLIVERSASDQAELDLVYSLKGSPDPVVQRISERSEVPAAARESAERTPE